MLGCRCSKVTEIVEVAEISEVVTIAKVTEIGKSATRNLAAKEQLALSRGERLRPTELIGRFILLNTSLRNLRQSQVLNVVGYQGRG